MKLTIRVMILALMLSVLLFGGAALAEGYPESQHPYPHNANLTWEYVHPVEADVLRIQFSDESMLASGGDYLYVISEDGTEQKFEYHYIRDRAVYVEGSRFTLRLTSNSYNNAYGFKVTDIQAITQARYDELQYFNSVFVKDQYGSVIISYRGTDEHVVVPSELNGYRITGMEDIFNSNTTVKSVVISEGIKTLYPSAFLRCSNLESITLPASLNIIYENAFTNCSSLKEVHIPSVEAWLGITFFSSNSSPMRAGVKLYVDGTLLTDLVIPEGVTQIGGRQFYCCQDLKTVTLPSTLTKLGTYAFAGCVNIEQITLPESLTSIGSYAFYGCDGIEEIRIPGSVTEMGTYAFAYCDGLKKVEICEGVTKISDYAFERCTVLEEIIFPRSLAVIGKSAFHHCSGLQELNLSEGLTTINESAFSTCKALHTVRIPAGMGRVTMGSNVFLDCTGMQRVYAGSVQNLLDIEFENYGFMGQAEGSGMLYIGGRLASDIVIPAGTTRIPKYAFYNFDNIAGVTLPSGIEKIERSAFGSCGNLVRVNVPSLRDWLMIEFQSSGFFNTNTELYADGELVTHAVIDEGITELKASVFYNYDYLESVTFPASLRTVGADAFYNCNKLENVHVDSVSDWLKIDFADAEANPMNCYVDFHVNGSAVRKLTVPAGIAQIKDYAFYGGRFTEVVISEGVTSVGANAFARCTQLQRVQLPDSLTSLGASVFYYTQALEVISIPAGVAEIPEKAFASSGLREIELKEGLVKIGSNAFSECNNLKNITFPASLQRIESGAFNNYYTKLTRLMFMGYELPQFSSPGFMTSTSSRTVYCHRGSDVDVWATNAGFKVVYIDTLENGTAVSIVLPDNFNLEVGQSQQMVVSVFPQSALSSIQWRSSDPSVVSVDNGTVTAHKEGKVEITATCGSASDTVNVTGFVRLQSFELNCQHYEMFTDETLTLYAVNCEPENATLKFEYSTSGTGGTVSAYMDDEYPGGRKWRVTATGEGVKRVIITEKYSGLKQECVIECFKPISDIEFSQETYYTCGGGQIQLVCNVTTGTQVLQNRFVNFCRGEWDENWDVASVDSNGLVTAKAPGTAIFEAYAWVDGEWITAECSVVVLADAHDIEVTEAVAPTCTTAGTTQSSKCRNCNTVLEAAQTIPATGHNEVVIPAVAPTYLANGLTEGLGCSNCDLVFTAQQTIPMLKLGRPVMGLSHVISSLELKLTWETVNEADGYELWRSDAADGTYTKIGETTALELTDNPCLFGKINYYKVRAYKNVDNQRAYSDFSVYRTCFGLATPGIRSLEMTEEAVKVTAATVANATGYYIYRCEDKYGLYDRLGTTTLANGGNSYLDTTAEQGTTYYYKCRAYYVSPTGVTYVGPFSVAKNITANYVQLDRPTMGLSHVISSLELKLTWERVPNADGYELWRSDAANGTYRKVGETTTALEYTDNPCLFGKINYYKVRAYKVVNGQRAYSDFSVYRTCFGLATPGIRQLEAKSNGIKVTAATVMNATGYYIYRCETPNGLYDRLGTTTLNDGVNTYLDSTAQSGKTYYYKCRAYYVSPTGVTYVGPFSVGKSCTRAIDESVVPVEVAPAAPACEHIAAIIEAVAPTCTETGLTEGKYCSECGEILIAQESIPATGHELEMAKDAFEVFVTDGMITIKAHYACGCEIEEPLEWRSSDDSILEFAGYEVIIEEVDGEEIEIPIYTKAIFMIKTVGEVTIIAELDEDIFCRCTVTINEAAEAPVTEVELMEIEVIQSTNEEPTIE